MKEYKKLVDKIVWWVPFKNVRNLVRIMFYNILDISELKRDISESKKYISELKKDISELKRDISESKKYISELKKDISELKRDTSELKRDTSELKIYIRRLNYNYKMEKFVYYISYVNFWKNFSIENNFLYKILKYIFNKYKKDIVFDMDYSDIELYSVFGKRNNISNLNGKFRIFYTGEAHTRYKEYTDNCLDLCDLSLGFNHINNDKYIRFPLWITRNFNVLDTNKDYILNKVIEINNAKFIKTKFASLVSTWGGIDNLREKIYNSVLKIDNINCPSKFMHNDDSLKSEFNNSKYEYLKQFKFNICPENCIEDGYITEKLFDAFKSGCIPIWNGDKNLEGDVINKNAIFYWNENSDNESILKEIKLLHENDELYDKFVSQTRLNTDNATEYIYGQIKLLHEKLEKLVCERFNL